MPKSDSVSLPTYGDDSVVQLIAHYGADRDTETVDGEEAVKRTMISTEILTELIMGLSFRRPLFSIP